MSSFPIHHHLSQCSSNRGVFTILAIDHRANLIDDMAKVRFKPTSYQDVCDFKSAVIRHLMDISTGLLIDPDYGFPALLASGVPASFGLLAPLEVTDYTQHPSQRSTHFISDWGVDRIKRAGCRGVKLLLYFHPDAANASAQTDLVDRIVAQCQQQHIPFFLEPIAYSLDPSASLNNQERAQVVIESARHFAQHGVDVLKLEFPVDVTEEPDERKWLHTLQELNAACSVPWVATECWRII
jgi:tagatose 1,6-diphosphate aldolase